MMRALQKLRAAGLCLLLGAVLPVCAQIAATPAARQQAADSRFLLERGIGVVEPGADRAAGSLAVRIHAARQQQFALLRSTALSAHTVGGSKTTWQPLGPLQLGTSAYGLVTGRVSSVAVDPNDTTGNTVYLGATGGGVWKSTNAAGNAGSVTFAPLTDDIAAFANSMTSIPSLSVGAITVEPGNPQVLLAGTGDPNDSLDSYYGVGILRSTNGGSTWSLIQQSSDVAVGGTQNYSLEGVGFAGFAWSTTTTGLVVAAVSQSLEGLLVNEGFESTAETGLYYSQDAGVTWHLATVSDGANEIIQSSDPATYPPGNPATAVVWNPQRQLFIAAIRFHGYYSSPNGTTWTRLANQPGANLTTANCPAEPGSTGSPSCPIFRGALAVQPVTGDTFALTTDINNQDQGLYRDVCSTSGLAVSSCPSSTITFGTQIADTAIDDPNQTGLIDQADYNLSLSAVSSQQDTLLFAGTEDIFRCSLANSCQWRNTTNDQTCDSAQVAPSTHAIDGTLGASGLMYFGTDGGLWRSTDAVAQTGAACASTDASHYQNLNGGLGSLAEVSHLAVSPDSGSLVLAGMGGFGVAASETAAAQSGSGAWQQLLTGEGSYTAINPANPDDWLASSGEGVSIYNCADGGSCTASDFGSAPVVGRSDVEDDADYFVYPAPWVLDPGNPSNILLGTCRVWLGPATGGWSASDLLSDMLDGAQQSFCDGNAELRSIAAGGSYNSSLGGERMYAGMAGPLDGGGAVPGHVYGATVPQGGGLLNWTDLWNSPVTNVSMSSQFNPAGYGIAAIAVGPHDSTGNSIYVGIAGFPSGAEGMLYSSSDGGAHWTNITNTLPFAPVNAIVVDPSTAGEVYVGGDFGVYYTTNVSNCVSPSQNCWSELGAGLPNAPVTDLKIASTGSGNVLEAATYGRGIWTLGLTTGTVTPQATLTPASYTFPAQAVGSESQTYGDFTLTNTGSVALTIGQINVTGDYAQTNNCGSSLSAGSHCTIQVTFTPIATGDRPGLLTVTANTQSGSLTATLDGTGLAPGTLTLSPSPVSFSQTATGTSSAPSNVTAQNTGGASLTLGALTIAGADPSDFGVASGNTCTGTLAPNATCTVPVIFHPVQTGTRTAQLQIAANVPGSPFSVMLTGPAISPADVTLTPGALTFPSTMQNSVSPAQSIMVGNTGQQPAQLGAASVSGDFLISANTCSSTLAAGATCTVSIEFAPTASGSRTGTFTLLSSSMANGQVTASLNGTGVAAGEVALSPASLAFGAVSVGGSSSQPATFTNSAGSAATLSAVSATGDFSVTGGTCQASGAVAVGSSCTITVTFSPTVLGSRTGTLTVTSNGAPATVQTSLSGSGATAATVAASPGSVAFGSVALQTSASAVVTFTNSGGVPATLGTPTVSGSGYSLGSDGCGTTLAANSACTVQVRFTPPALGASSGSLTLSGQFNGSPVMVALNGTGIASVLSFQPNPVSFGSVVTGSTAAQPVTITNVVTTSVSLGTPTVAGGFGLTSACGSSLQAGASCTMQVSFSPTSTGAQSSVLSVPTPGNGGPATAALSGTGVSPGALTASPTSLSFATTEVGSTSAAASVTFSNSGGSALTLSVPRVSLADYAVSSNSCGTSLAAGSSCTMAVTFTPTAAGSRSGILTLASTGSASAQVALNGTGLAAASLAFSPASLGFGGENINTTSASQSLALENSGGVSTSLGMAVVTGEYAITSNTCGASLAAGATCAIAVQFAPTGGGTQAGSVSIAGSSGTPKATASLSGTGYALELAPTSITFTPALSIGSSSAPSAVAVENLGATTISLGTATITGDFAIGPSSCGSTLAANSSCALYITFTPTASGQRTGLLTFSDGTETHTVQLSGNGLGAATDTLSPSALAFGVTTEGQVSAPQSVTLTNGGDSTLTRITAAVSGPFVVANNCGSSLGGHLSCAISVSFAPTAAGSATGTLTVADELRTQTVGLTGTGATPAIPAANPNSIDFGPYAVNVVTPAQIVTVSNGGGTAMEGVTVTSSLADFAVTSSSCGTSLAAGASCQIGVTFTPAAIGIRQGTLKVSSTSLSEPLIVSLSGSGEDYGIAVSGATQEIVTAGQTASYQLTITPVGASAGSLTLSCSGAPATATCTMNPTALTLSGGAAGSATLNIATTGTATTTAARRGGASPRGAHGWPRDAALALIVPVLLLPRRRYRRLVCTLLALALLGAPIACGVHASGSNDAPTQNGSYTITVTASFPGAARTATVSLVVQ